MANIRMSGPPPLAWIAQQLAQQDAFQRDARHIVELPEADYAGSLAVLAAQTGFIGSQRLQSLLGSTIGEERAVGFANFVFTLSQFRRDLGYEPEEMGRLFAHAVGPSLNLKPAAAEILSTRLARLAQPFPGVEKQAKAQKLATATGEHVKDLSLFCDLRPIFDATGEVVEGFVPVTLLRVALEDASDSVIELALTSAQLDELTELAERARKKLRAIRELMSSLEAQGIHVPEQ